MPKLYLAIMASLLLIIAAFLLSPDLRQTALGAYGQFIEEKNSYPGQILPYNGNTVMPLERMSVCSDYGPRPDPITNEPSFHLGVDICAGEGTAVRAVRDGNIVGIGYNHEINGNWVEIQHTDGTFTTYAHLSKIANISLEDHVGAGSVIGAVGNTGRSTGPHLHFGVKDKDGSPIDPKIYLGLEDDQNIDIPII
ncbi:MAG: M23 family metallopeptidase [Candidatus Aenigmarchaeota archaeon]|nr:M23 family metallopeptidase [Candidatus Aenigmarchaeota archaeon]